MTAPRFHIDEIRFAERDVVLRLPFRFGAVTVTACPQVYVQVRIGFADGSSSEGCAAEMMIPKWFDKNPALSNEDNFNQLRQALQLAREAYRADRMARTAWGHFAAHYDAVLAAGAARQLHPLVASYGPALIDRAVLDALCLHLGGSFAAAMQANAVGMTLADNALASDLAAFDIDSFLASRVPHGHIAARHTVGLLDAIREADAPADAPHDGLPRSLEGAIAQYGHRHFKLKLCGDTAADLARLQDIAELIAPHAQLVTLDGNEQYGDAAAFGDFLDQLMAQPALQTLVARTAFIEQPIRRDRALATDLRALAQRMPLLVDESDATLGSFVQAQALGYTGVSSKSCKGFYKSVVNAARCAQAAQQHRAPLFLSGEDLTMQAGIGVQQDLALVSWLGLTHVERNGHHYVDGLAAAPAAEQQALLALHPDLYTRRHGHVRLAIEGGDLQLSSLGCAGFASGATGAGIDWIAMARHA